MGQHRFHIIFWATDGVDGTESEMIGFRAIAWADGGADPHAGAFAALHNPTGLFHMRKIKTK